MTDEIRMEIAGDEALAEHERITAREKLLEHCHNWSSYDRRDAEVYESVLRRLTRVPGLDGDDTPLSQFYIWYKEDVPRLIQALTRIGSDLHPRQ